MTLDVTVGGSAADSYSALAAWETYASNAGWTTVGTDAVKETHLRRATQWLDRNYVWAGYAATQAQSLAWPRVTGLYVDGWSVDTDTIPDRIIAAQQEMAWLIHEGLDPFATVTGGSVKRSKVKAGPVESETEYASTREMPRLVSIEGLIRPFTVSSESSVRVVRG